MDLAEIAVGYLAGKCIQWIEDKVKENPLYLKLSGNVNIDISHNKELNQLLVAAIKNARENTIIRNLSDNEILTSITKNYGIIFDCVVLSRGLNPIEKYFQSILFENDNEEYQNRIKTFYNSIYNHINDNKSNYSTLQTLQILQGISDIETKIDSQKEILNYASRGITTLLDIATLTYNEELNAIEEKVNKREYIKAREMAILIEGKVRKNNNEDEIEKLYMLIINTYLLQEDDQSGALDYFDKLIVFTKDNDKRRGRNALKLLIQKNISQAQSELDKIFNEYGASNGTQLDYENQINIFFLQGKYKEAVQFIYNNKENIQKHQYYLALAFIQLKNIDGADKLLLENERFFVGNDFNIREIRIQIQVHSMLNRFRTVFEYSDIAILEKLSLEIDLLIKEIGDCQRKKSYFYSIGAMIKSALFHREDAEKDFIKALELDPNNANAIVNYSFLLLGRSRQDIQKGVNLLEKYLPKHPDSIEEKILYYSGLAVINPQKVIYDLSIITNLNLELKMILVQAYDAVFDIDKAMTIINELLDTNQTFPLFICAGCHFANIKLYDKALDYYFMAYEKCENEANYDSIFYYLLRTICCLNDIDKMTIIKTNLELKYHRDIILLRYPYYYLRVLITLKDYSRCIECCSELRKKGNSEAYIAEFEFICYYETRNFVKAKELLDENSVSYTDDLLMRMGHAYASIGELNLAKTILERIKNIDTKEKYIAVSILQFTVKDFKKAIFTIFSAYKIYPEDKEIQERFIELVFGHGVKIESNAMAVSFKDCLERYRTAGYNDKTITELHIPPNSTGEDILKLLSEQFPQTINLNEQINSINSQHLPVSFFRFIYKRNLIPVNYMVRNSTDHEIWIAEKFGNEVDNIQNTELYIDSYSLLTLDLLGLLELVKNTFVDIFLTQSTFDEFLQFDLELDEPYIESSLWFCYNKSSYGIHTAMPEIRKDLAETTKRIINYIKDSSNIHIIGSVLFPKNKISTNFNDFLNKMYDMDRAESDTMRFSILDNRQIMIENSTLRISYNIQENAQQNFGIDSLLLYFLKNNLISEEKYILLLTKLIDNNYFYIPISAKHLHYIIQREGYIISDRHAKLFQTFCSLNHNHYGLEIIFSRLLVLIWNDSITAEKKKDWTEYLLNIFLLHPSTNDRIEYIVLYSVGLKIISKQHLDQFILFVNEWYKLKQVAQE
ncbi:hypothetical protein AGMMS50268_28780 [Spirochaetia bacterium]|nr:hypothetical protein AGMMS50268_28780 [Spirochaetia bacterium]